MTVTLIFLICIWQMLIDMHNSYSCTISHLIISEIYIRNVHVNDCFECFDCFQRWTSSIR